jgi:hypothetical protein
MYEGSLTMAKIQLALPKARTGYRNKLPQGLRSKFDALVSLIDSPRDDLAWHAQVGRLIGELQQYNPEAGHGKGWFKGLSEALGTGDSLLNKAYRFSEEYNPAQVQRLEKMGVNWTRAYLTFVVHDRSKRFDLLRQAVAGDWPEKRLRSEVQQHSPPGRRGVGGRPKRDPSPMGPEPALRELKRCCRNWLDFRKHTWAKLKPSDWKKLVRTWPAAERAKLRQLLQETADAVAAVVQEGSAVRDALEKLLQKK